MYSYGEPWTVSLNPLYVVDKNGRYIADVKLDEEDPRALACVRLIIVAPDLLLAAKLEERASSHFENCEHCKCYSCGVHTNLRREAATQRVAAIAKAEGRQ